MSVTIEATDLPGLGEYLSRYADASPQAMRLAINQTAERRALPISRDEIGTQVNFPKGYLNDDRLGITKRATNADLEAVISARARPTSLVRFLAGTPLPGHQKNGVTVRVKPGESRVMKTAFVVRLKAGNLLDGANANLGLALRVKPGDAVKNKREGARPFAPNVYLLYGPSVDQVFRDVSEDVMRPVSDYLADEFLRQLARLLGE